MQPPSGYQRQFPTLSACLADRVAGQADKAFLKCGSRWLTYGEMGLATDRLAAGITELGVKGGDRVALLLPNCAEMALSLLALARIGAISVPLNIYLRGEFLKYQLNDSAAATLITDESGIRAVSDILAQISGLHLILNTESDKPAAISDEVAGLPWSQAAGCGLPPLRTDIRSSDPLTILYTSGTTGMPKGCVCSHGYFMAALVAPLALDILNADDVVITAYPLFHAAGFNFCLVGALAAGASICIEPTFSASSFMRRVREEHATVALGLGTMAAAILTTPPGEGDGAHRLRYCSWPGAPVEVQLGFEDRFGAPVHVGAYGQTEALGLGWISPEEGRRHRTSLGRPSPLLEVAIVDEEDQALAVGAVGELVVRPRVPEAIFQGYWGKPQETLESRRNLWHHTGDLARLDDAGLLYYVDRKTDSIRRRGENISSVELEAAIRRHPAVEMCAAFAVPSPLGGDDIKVSMSLREGCAATPEDLFSFFKDALPYYAIPRYVEVVSTFPLTATGRIMKAELRRAGVGDAWDLEALGLILDKAERRA